MAAISLELANNLQQSGKSMVNILSEILDKEIKEKNIHSKILCNKCHKTCIEYDSIQIRLQVIKSLMLTQFKKTLPRHNLDYDTYNEESSPTKFSGKKIVLPASKLQPLPSNFVLKSGKLGTTPLSNFTSKLNNPEIRILSPSTLNLKVTVGSSVLTQSIKTTGVTNKQRGLTHTVTSSVTSTLTSVTSSVTSTSFTNTKTTSPVLSFTLEEPPKDIFSGELNQSSSPKSDENDDDPVNDDQPMEIDEACSLAVITTTANEGKLIFEDIDKLDIVARENGQFKCLICERNDSEGAQFVGSAANMAQHMRSAHGARIHICALCGLILRKKADYLAHLIKEFICKVCGKAFGALHNLEVHGVVHSGNKPFVCGVCSKGFARRAEVRDHMRIHTGERPFSCEECGARFTQRSNLHSHRRATHLDDKRHVCHLCPKRFKRRRLIEEQKHMHTHTGSKPHTCSVCIKSFASKYTLQSHLKTHLDRPRPFKCTQCGKSFLTQQNLNQHEKTHSGVKEFICKVCGKAFGALHNLEVHGVVHSGNKPFVCGVCSKGFARRAEVRDHMRIHTGERPFSCEECGARFTQRSNLHSHRRATHLDDKRHVCHLCPKRFKRRRLLDYHVKASHTGERPLQCEVCQASFVYPEHFKKHMRIHSGEKPYSCEVCGRQFNTRDNLNTHRYVHSDKKPYECVVCSAGYMRKQQLYHHMKNTGHLAESIVVNQPRILKVPQNVVTSAGTIIIDPGKEEDTADIRSSGIFEETQEENVKPIENSTLDIIQNNEVQPLITLHNISTEKDNSILETISEEQLTEDNAQITTVDATNTNVTRLIQFQLPDGTSGWLAV
ncbi:Zinc finger protein 235 [Papilio machaon]|uniref:Zinc finger protein 235 n=1 Tax=Papilio machaon TaxID=76193 RepID=A0A0N1I8A6_PAPMA|nr:Zinc finger protein 235 [Papilio machaon]